MIPIRHPRTRQPQSSLPLSRPLASGRIYLPGVNDRDWISGNAPSVSAIGAVEGEPLGKTRNFAASTWRTNYYPSGGPFSIFVRHRRTATPSGFERVLSALYSGSRHTAVEHVDVRATYALLLYFSSAGGQWEWPAADLNVWRTTVITHDGSTSAPSVWVNGVKQTLTVLSTPAGTRTVTAEEMYVANHAGGDRGFTGQITLCGHVPLLLPDNVAKNISLNPWQLFAPAERRIWVPVSAAGGGVDLVIADATHAHAADAPTLTTTWLLTVADATHGHAAEAPTLSTEWLLAPADALHGHAADNLTLEPSGSANLAPADATHGHTADAITLTTASLLAVQDALHAHAAEAATLSTEWLLAPADATHAHAADNLTLSDAPALLIAEALHAHTADGVTMTVDAWLVLADATHGHLADNVVLFVPGGTTVREVLRLSSPLRRAVAGASTLARTVAGSSALTRTVALASDIDAESTTP